MISLIIQNTSHYGGKKFDVSLNVGILRLETEINRAGKLIFDFIKTDIPFFEGSRVTLMINSTVTFVGYIVKKMRTKEQIITVTCLDQMFYLQNKDTYIFQDKTAGEMITAMATDFGITRLDIADTKYLFSNFMQDAMSLIDISQKALDETLYHAGVDYFLYDIGGVLTLKDKRELKTQIKLVIEDYKYTTDISNDRVANQIVVVQEVDNAIRYNKVFLDSTNIAKWGVIQHYYKSTSSENNAQLDKLGVSLLTTRNKLDRTITLKIIGDERLRAGLGVVLDVEDIAEISIIGEHTYIKRCTHTIISDMITTELEVHLN